MPVNIHGLKALGFGSKTYSALMLDILLKALRKKPSPGLLLTCQLLIFNYEKRSHPPKGWNIRRYKQPLGHLYQCCIHSPTGFGARSPTSSAFFEWNWKLGKELGLPRHVVNHDKKRIPIGDQTRRLGIPAAAVLQTNTNPSCFCRSTKQSTQTCGGNLPLDQKKKKLFGDMWRFQCTKKGHRSRDCHAKVSCSCCAGRHTTSTCDPNWKLNSKDNGQKAVITSVQNSSSRNVETSFDKEILLQTFRAWAISENQSCYFRANIDGGSQWTFTASICHANWTSRFWGRRVCN